MLLHFKRRSGAVYKGFYSPSKAQAGFKSAETTGLLEKLRNTPRDALWVVIEGAHPGVYRNR